MTEQNTQAWLDMRKDYLGASDAPVIMNGVHFKKTPYMLWQEKLNLADFSQDHPGTRGGKLNEEPARVAYEKETGIVTVAEVVYHKKINYLMASLDGINATRDLVTEFKNPCEADHAIAQGGNVPPKYIPQVQAQIACSEVNMGHYWSFHEGCGVLVEVKKDNEYIDLFYEKAEKFWDCVLSFIPPEINEYDHPDLSENVELVTEMNELALLDSQIKSLLKQKESRRKTAISMGGNRSIQANGHKITRVISKGRVDYVKIPELKGIDIDTYRKEPSESFLFTYKKD